MSLFKVAMIQHRVTGPDQQKNTKLAIQYIIEAKEQGADIVLFPECFITSYEFPKICEELLPIEKVEQDEEFVFWCENTFDEQSLSMKQIQETAKTLAIGVVITGFSKGKKYPRNTAYMIGRDGSILLKYSKVHTCDFDVERYLEGGEGFHVCQFDGITLGVMICYDREYPESARELMLQGAELILMPNDCEGMKPRLRELSVRAMENMTGIAMANPPGKYAGNSCAYSPIVWAWDENGELIDNQLMAAEAEYDGIQYASFDMDAIRDYRQREDQGKYRKVEAYKYLK